MTGADSSAPPPAAAAASELLLLLLSAWLSATPAYAAGDTKRAGSRELDQGGVVVQAYWRIGRLPLPAVRKLYFIVAAATLLLGTPKSLSMHACGAGVARPTAHHNSSSSSSTARRSLAHQCSSDDDAPATHRQRCCNVGPSWLGPGPEGAPALALWLQLRPTILVCRGTPSLGQPASTPAAW